MGDYLKVHDELTRFASKVPPQSAFAQSFHTDELGGQMPGIQSAAEAHSRLTLAMQQFVNQADDGLAAYKSGAQTVDAAYSGTDSNNAAQLNGLITGTFEHGGSPVGGRGDMAAPGRNAPEALSQAPSAPVAPNAEADYWDIPDAPYTGSDRLPTPWTNHQPAQPSMPVVRH